MLTDWIHEYLTNLHMNFVIIYQEALLHSIYVLMWEHLSNLLNGHLRNLNTLECKLGFLHTQGLLIVAIYLEHFANTLDKSVH